MVHGSHLALLACASLAVAGGVLAWLTISSDALESEPAPGRDLPTAALHDFSCTVAGPPLRPGREPDCHPIAVKHLRQADVESVSSRRSRATGS